MRKHCLQAIFIVTSLLSFFLQTTNAQIAGDYRSISSGDWDVESTWQFFNGVEWIPAVAGQIPKLTNQVVIQSGHTILLKSTSECKSLQILEGGTLSISGKSLYTYGDVLVSGRLKGSNLANSSYGSWYIRGDNPSVRIDGILGGTQTGSDGEGIILYMYQTSGTKLKLSGSGIVNISALLVKSASANNYIADIDIDMNLKNSYPVNPALSLQNLTSGVNSERVINILSGRKVVITDPSGCFHALQNTGVNSSGGKMTYNIFGTLDVSFGKLILASNSSSVGNQLQLNIHSGGKLIVGNSINLCTNLIGQTAPAIHFYSGSSLQFKGAKSPQISCLAVSGANLPVFPWQSLENVFFDFNDTFNLTESLVCKKLFTSKDNVINVLPGVHLVISDSLVHQGKLIFQSDISGTSTFNSPVQISGDGIYEFHQDMNLSRNWYVSSPLNDALIPSEMVCYSFSEPNASWEVQNSGAKFLSGKGYILQSGASSILNFSGKSLNQHSISTLTRTPGNSYSGFNLCGNPFPSYLNIDNLLQNDQIEPSFWLRTKKNDRYVFDSYNIAGGISISNSGLTVNRWIPPLQAFWLKVKPGFLSSTIDFQQFARGPQDNKLNLFRNSKNEAFPEIRIILSDGLLDDESLIYLHPMAKDEIDKYDTNKMFDNNQYPQIYCIIDYEELAINGLHATELNSTNISDKVVPIGIKCISEKNYLIRCKLSNFIIDSAFQLFFRDNYLDTEIPIQEVFEYRFHANNHEITDRFSIHFRTKEIQTKVHELKVYKSPEAKAEFINGQILLKKYEENQIKYFDVNGRQIK